MYNRVKNIDWNPRYPCMASIKRSIHLEILKACRPRQWTKNFLVFSPVLFSFQLDARSWSAAVLAFVSFSLISSAVYIFNDVRDVSIDRAHPSKRFRPIARGVIPIPLALLVAVCLTLTSLTLAATCMPALFGVLLAYVFIQVLYCLWLKQEPLLDVFCIASGFLLRAIAGVVTAGLDFSPWFLLTVGLLALFLSVEKRKAELRLCKKTGLITRPVLERYSLPLLLRLENLVSTSAFLSYSLWASGPVLNGASTSWMLLSVPFVLVGIFRYQLISDPKEAERRSSLGKGLTSEKPEEILLGDSGIKFILLGWLITVAAVGTISR